MLRVILILFILISQTVWANPFAPFFKKSKDKDDLFYKQTPPFQDPYQRNSNLDEYELDLTNLNEFLKEEKLNELEAFYRQFDSDTKLNIYHYPFELGKTWETLPYPIIRNIDGLKPSEWISHFNFHEKEISHFQERVFLEKINSKTSSKVFSNNNLELLETPKSFEKIKNKILNSKNHVLMTTFLFQCDAGSEELLELMEKKIQNGLRIYLILDSTFSLADRGCIKRLKKIGVNVALQGTLTKIFHEKMYVFDGEYGIVDGQNIVAAQTLSNGHNNLINDTGIGIYGPMVSELAKRFIYHWEILLKETLPRDIKNFYKKLNEENLPFSEESSIQEGLSKKMGVCRLVTNTPDLNKSILDIYKAYIENSQRYIFFNMIDLRFENKFGNDIGNNFLKLISQKVKYNPEMRIDMLSNHWKLPTDIALPKGLAAKPTLFSQLVTRPGKVILKRPHEQITKGRNFFKNLNIGENFHWWASSLYVHSKTLMIDNIVTMIGSYNINPTSENSSYEQTLICHDEKLAQDMQKLILKSQLNSIPIFIR